MFKFLFTAIFLQMFIFHYGAETGNISDIRADVYFKVGVSQFYGENNNMQSYEKAVASFSKAYERGHLDAGYHLAFCLLQGFGVTKDLEEGLRIILHLAHIGHVSAMSALGMFFDMGIVVPVNKDIAKKWYEAAAEHNDPVGEFNLGCLYLNEPETPESSCTAFEWFSKSASKKYTKAMYNLGICYYLGCGVQQSKDTAIFILKQTASLGYDFAAYQLSFMLLQKNEIEEAVSVLDDLVKKNDPRALFETGVIYLTHQNYFLITVEDARSLIAKAADLGYPPALNFQGLALCTDEPVSEENRVSAFEHFRRAASVGDKLGKYNLACCYLNGIGVPTNPFLAIQQFEELVEDGDRISQ